MGAAAPRPSHGHGSPSEANQPVTVSLLHAVAALCQALLCCCVDLLQ